MKLRRTVREGARRRPRQAAGTLELLESRQLLSVTIREFPTSGPFTFPVDLTVGPDGAIYAALSGSVLSPGAIARVEPGPSGTATITEVPVGAGTAPFSITTGPDGNLWFTQVGDGLNAVSRYTLSGGVITPTALGPPDPSPLQITTEPGGAGLWFTEIATGAVSRVDLTGTVTTTVALPAGYGPYGITAGPDGNIWFGARDGLGDRIVIRRILVATGTLDPTTEIVILNEAAPSLESLIVGPDGNLWFTLNGPALTMGVGRVAPASGSTPTLFDTGPARRITNGPGGALYYTESGSADGAASVGRITVDGSIAEFDVPTAGADLVGIAATPDGQVWFSDQSQGRIGVLEFPPALIVQPASFSAPQGQAVAPVVATVVDPGGIDPLGNYTATIDWGDGSPTSAGTFTVSGETLLVTGTHTYAQLGTFPVRVTISNTSDFRTTTVVGQAQVSSATLTGNTTPVVALAGTPTSTLTVATFEQAGVVVTPSAFTALVNFGDGSPTVPGQVVVNGGVASVQVPARTFAVPGVYGGGVTIAGVAGSPTLTLPLSVTVNGFTAAGAPLSALAGTPTAPGAVIGTITPAAGTAEAGAYSVAIDFGSGQPAVPGTVVAGAGGALNILAPTVLYAAPGAYTIRYTVAVPGNPSLAVGTSTATVQSPVLMSLAPSGVSVRAGQPLDAALATILVQGGAPALAPQFYSVSIDYGDGTSPSVVPAPAAGVPITGQGRVYGRDGAFTARLTLLTSGGLALSSVSVPVTVTSSVPAPSAPYGVLTPESDTGASDRDNITNDSTPTFNGVGSPGSIVRLFAQQGTGPARLIGQGVVDAAGSWTITTVQIADGSYTITADATTPGGTATAQLLPLANPPLGAFPPARGAGPLVIDTVAPRVVGLATLGRHPGQFRIQFRDDRSGMAQATIVDGANYQFRRLSTTPLGLYRQYMVRSLAAGADGAPGAAQDVTITVGSRASRGLQSGQYVMTVGGAIADVAGNLLDGNYYGSLPSGNGAAGGSFIAGFVVPGCGRVSSIVPLAVDTTASPTPAQLARSLVAQARRLARGLTARG